MRGTEVYRVLEGAASSTSRKLNEAVLESYHLEVDEMFARLHFADKKGHYDPAGNAEREEYLAIHRDMTNDEIHSKHLGDKVYRRLEFDKRSDLNNFINYLRDKDSGVPPEVIDKMAVAPVKIHGKWLMEIPEKTSVAGDDNRSIETERFIQDYQNKTGLDVKSYNYRDDYGDARDPYTQESVSDTVHGVFFNEITAGTGELGHLVRNISRIEALQNAHGDMNQSHALDAKVRHDEHGKLEGGFFTGIRNDVKAAKVLGGETVVMDGRDITNTREGQRVLKMHQQRTAMAENYLNSKGHQLNESLHQKISDSDMSYRAKSGAGHIVDVVSGERHNRRAANATAIQERAGNQTYASGHHNYGRFEGGAINKLRNDYGEQTILYRQTAGDVTISKDLMSALTKAEVAGVKFTALEKEFLKDLHTRVDENGGTLSFTHGDRMRMTDVIDKIDRHQNADPSLLNKKEAAAISKENERTSEGGQFRYSDAEVKYYGINFGIKTQLDAIYNDLGIDFDFKTRYGQKMSAMQLNHIDPNLVPLLGFTGAAYYESAGSFVKDGVPLNKDAVISSLKSIKKNILDETSLSLHGGSYYKDGIRLTKAEAITEFQKYSDAHGNALLGKKVTFDGTNYSKYGYVLNEDEVLDMFEKNIRKLDRKGKELADDMDEKLKKSGYAVKSDGTFRHSHGSDISTADILKLDKAFLSKAERAGFNFITIAGTFDVKALKNLTAADMQRIGISNATRAALLKFHANDGNFIAQKFHGGSAAWGTHNFKLTKKAIGKAGKGFNAAAGGNKLVGEGDEETAQFMQMKNSYQSVGHHVKQIRAYGKQYADAAGAKINEFKAKHVKNNNSGGGNGRKLPKKKNIAERRGTNPAKTEKYLKKQEKRRKMVEKSEKRMEFVGNVYHRLDVKSRAKEWAANTKIGKGLTGAFNKIKAALIKLIGSFLAVYFLIGGAVVGVVVIISMIQSLLNLPYEGLKKLVVAISGDDRPAAIVLYKYMNDEMQETWLEGLRDYEEIFDNKSNIKYTISYDDYNTYISNFKTLKLSPTGDLYVNPFSYVGDDVPLDNCKHLTEYNGVCDTALITNPSVYGEKDGTSGYVSTESGHTNNIKDILAMVDVMYNFDINKFGDDTLQDVLAEPPAAIDFEDFWNKATGVLKWAGDCVKKCWNKLCSFFGGDDDDDEGFPSLEDYWGGTVKYGTIQNYCSNLYLASHQEIVNLDVKFLPMQDIEAKLDGEVKDISMLLSTQNASRLGVCNEPDTADFKIDYNGSKSSNKIYPYLTNSSGVKVDLSAKSTADETGIPLTMKGTYGRIADADEACLWNSMAENKGTYDEIYKRAHSPLPDCWSVTSETKDYESYDAWGDNWHDDEGDAKNEAYMKVYNKYDYYYHHTPSVPKEFTLSGDHNAFTRVWKEACFEDDHCVTVDTRQVEDGTEMVQLYWTNGKFGGNLSTDDASGSRNAAGVYVITDTDGNEHEYYADEDAEYKDFYTDRITIIRGDGSEVTEEFDYTAVSIGFKWLETEQVKYKTQYKAKWTAKVLCTNTEIFGRECEGHEFYFSGGAVGCHVKGVVYSATNEQMTLAGMYKSQDIMPLARDYDMEAMGYDKIRGKIIKSEVNYEGTARTGATTGGCPSPEEDIQGSAVNRGLNLYTVGDDELGKDFDIRDDVAVQTIRDIFDVDCMIDKGSNVFPWKAVSKGGKGWKEYEGWTADNITYVCMRITIDWNELYGFDIPTELGSVSLSEADIKFLSDALTAEYGSNYTDTRKDAIEFALHWVSRGHYSKEHQDHDFLLHKCKAHAMSKQYGSTTYTTSYDANCTASDSQGFVNFYLKEFGKNDTSHWYSYLWQNLSSTSTLKPADIFYRKRELDYTKYDFDDNDAILNHGDAITDALCEFRDNDNYGIYIGTFDKVFDSGISVPKGIEIDGDTITLTNGYEIHKGIPVTLDLSLEPRESGSMFGMEGNSGAGTVRLRTGESSGYGQTTAEQNFYWLLHPDSNTFYRSFE